MIIFLASCSRELLLFLWNLTMALKFFWDQLGFSPFSHLSGCFYFLGFCFVILLNLKFQKLLFHMGFCPENQDALASSDRLQSSPSPLQLTIPRLGCPSFKYLERSLLSVEADALLLSFPSFSTNRVRTQVL